MPLKAEGEFALVKASLEGALDKPGQPVSWGTMAHDHEVYAMLADVAVEMRDEEALRTYAPRLEALALRDNHALYLAIAQRAGGVALGVGGDFAGAEARLRVALAGFERLGTAWQVGRTLMELGEVELARSQGDAARSHFSQAQAAFESIQAQPAAERARARQRSSGV